MLKVFLLVAVITLFSAVLLKAARWLLDALLLLLTAAAAGTLAGRWASSDATTATAAGVLVFVALVPFLWRLRNHLRRDRAAFERRVLPEPPAVGSGSEVEVAPIVDGAGASENAWDRLLEGAPECRARLSVAGRAFDRYRASTGSQFYDPAAHQTLIMIDRRLPELIDAELGSASPLPSPERRRALSALVDLVEKLAADCERQLSAADRMGQEASVIRLHIERYLEERPGGTL